MWQRVYPLGLAIQLAAQNPPQNWQIEQLTQWKKDRKVLLNFSQTMNQFDLNDEAENKKLADLLRFYYATISTTENLKY